MTPLVLALAAGAANLAGALVVVRGSRSGTRTIEGAIADNCRRWACVFNRMHDMAPR